MRPARIVPQRLAGIPGKCRAPFWIGARAEALAAERAATLAAEKEEKRALKANARAERRTDKRIAGSTKRERTPGQQLKRLQRALSKRKTLAGRQSVQRQIDALLRERDE